MYKNRPTDIIRQSLKIFNDKHYKTLGVQLRFDEVDLSNRSLCLTTSLDSNVKEEIADVTGQYNKVTMDMALLYRTRSSLTDASKHLDYMDFLRDVYDKYSDVVKTMPMDRAYLVNIKSIKEPVLNQAYDGGLKDFVMILRLVYERRVK